MTVINELIKEATKCKKCKADLSIKGAFKVQTTTTESFLGSLQRNNEATYCFINEDMETSGEVQVYQSIITNNAPNKISLAPNMDRGLRPQDYVTTSTKTVVCSKCGHKFKENGRNTIDFTINKELQNEILKLKQGIERLRSHQKLVAFRNDLKYTEERKFSNGELDRETVLRRMKEIDAGERDDEFSNPGSTGDTTLKSVMSDRARNAIIFQCVCRRIHEDQDEMQQNRNVDGTTKWKVTCPCGETMERHQ